MSRFIASKIQNDLFSRRCVEFHICNLCVVVRFNFNVLVPERTRSWQCTNMVPYVQASDREQRRSTIIEVHSNCSEAPNVRSSIPHPNTDVSKNQIASRSIFPLPMYVYKKRYFSETRLTFRRFWVKGPRHSANILTEINVLPLLS